ncbi:MAG: OmpA family protein [bacterium]
MYFLSLRSYWYFKHLLKRIVQLLADSQYHDRCIILIGFADNLGNRNSNLDLSIDRANSVKQEPEQALKEEGIRNGIVAAGFGQTLPIASNSTKEGRGKNRRIEIWLKRKRAYALNRYTSARKKQICKRKKQICKRKKQKGETDT